MELNSHILKDIVNQFSFYTDLMFEHPYKLNMYINDSMTHVECLTELECVIRDTFPINVGHIDPITNKSSRIFTEEEFHDFLTDLNIYLDKDELFGDTIVHNKAEHEEWFQTTDAYKQMQEENDTFNEALYFSKEPILRFPELISPQDRRFKELLPTGSDFRFVVGKDDRDCVYLMGIGDVVVDPPEFHIFPPEGFMNFSFYPGIPPHTIVFFDSVESAKDAAEYLATDLTRTDITESDIPEYATDRIQSFLEKLGIDIDSCFIQTSPRFHLDDEASPGFGYRESKDRKEMLSINVLLTGHGKTDDPSRPMLSFRNWKEVLDWASNLGELLVPFEESDHSPVYKNSFRYAETFGETTLYEQSVVNNIDCLNAIHEIIGESSDKHNVPKSSLNYVINTFGDDRVSWVLANVVASRPFLYSNHDEKACLSLRSWAYDIYYQGSQLHNYAIDANKLGITDPYEHINTSIALDNNEYDEIMADFIFKIQPLLQDRSIDFGNEYGDFFEDKLPEVVPLREKVAKLEKAKKGKAKIPYIEKNAKTEPQRKNKSHFDPNGRD